jgi:intracellular multiplication protein IcmB
MIDFATAIYIMDAGPAQSVEKTCKIFGLNDTAKQALINRVHGPRQGGGTFLVQYATKNGINVQVLTLTLGPIELWAFSTTAEDVIVRNRLYRAIGPVEARRFLGALFPSGSAIKELNRRLNVSSTEEVLVTNEQKESVIDKMINDILQTYANDPNTTILLES